MTRQRAAALIGVVMALGLFDLYTSVDSSWSESQSRWITAVTGLIALWFVLAAMVYRGWSRVPLLGAATSAAWMIKSTLFESYDPSGFAVLGYIYLSAALVLATALALVVLFVEATMPRHGEASVSDQPKQRSFG